ncbi:MAG: hypothetical protein JXB50_05310 [Spirochaetes bacterium]|nr:hypothetical protein [Spirochaetota bacterium]
MKTWKIVYFFIFFLLINCTTVKFGEKDNIFDLKEEGIKGIKEFELNYAYKVMGVPVSGKGIAEKVFSMQDDDLLFFCISFPKVGIIKTDNYGRTFTGQYFKLGYLNKLFGYDEEKGETKKTDNERILTDRIFYKFAYSPKDKNKIVITYGPYIFLSEDKADNWEVKNIFFDIENTVIRDVFITEKEEIIVITANNIHISSNWGKKWSRKSIKIDNINKFDYMSGLIINNIIYASMKYDDEPDELLSKSSYDFFYNNINGALKSGIYYSEDMGATWQKTKINIPAVLWRNNNAIYAGPIYPLHLYKAFWSEEFKKSELYKNAVLNDSTINFAHEYFDLLLKLKPDDYDIISVNNNRIIKVKDYNEYEVFEEKDFNNLVGGIIKLQDMDYVQYDKNLYRKKKSNNFFYEYNLYRLIKIWTGMRTNSPVLYAKDSDYFYRITMDDEFFKKFIKYSIDKQIKLNSINPFLRKSTDIEFIDPAVDPTNGFPVKIEYSGDAAAWNNLLDSKYIRNIIDPLNSKRSALYWYKNVDQKKLFKLQLSFGFDKGVDFMVYPIDFMIINKNILLNINYFSLSKNYKELYSIPINLKKDK